MSTSPHRSAQSAANPVNLGQALSIATEAHHGQTRRHGAPYIAHPVAVKRIVEEIGAAVNIPVDDGMRAAALLHDVIEDSEITADEIGARFGEDVAARVMLLTKSGKGPDATHAYYAKLSRAGDDVRLLKVCDRLHNLSELHLSPDETKLEKYVVETLDYVVPLARGTATPGAAHGLVAALYDAIRAASRAQGKPAPEVARLPAWARVPTGVYAIVDSAERVQQLVDGGVALIQVRVKDAGDRAVLAVIEDVLRVAKRFAVPVIVNDRADLCVAAGAQGVHVGQGDLPRSAARKILGPDALLGASTHTDPELDDAAREDPAAGCDHVAVGPVFASTTKSGHAPVVGLAALDRRAALTDKPVVAIGGITSPERAMLCARAGAQLVAAVSALDVDNAREVCRRMSLAFFAARGATRGSST